MAQLYYRYGTMNSGKSIEILKVAYNYEEQNKKVALFTSGMDDREEIGKIASRIGMNRSAMIINDDTNIFERVKNLDEDIYCVLIDEAQFLTKEHIYQLAKICDDLNIDRKSVV